MTVTYKKYKNSYGEVQNGVFKIIDGVYVICIPFDPANRDYQEYLKWVNGEFPYTEKGVTEEAD